MRCAHCKESGPNITVAQIKACSEGAKDAHVKPTCEGMFPDPEPDPFMNQPQWPASDAQIKYVKDLQDERILPDDYKVKEDVDLRLMERDEVSSLINLLKSFPKHTFTKRGEQRQWDVPEGRYALTFKGPNGKSVWRFFEVSKGKDRWEGYTFIRRLIGAPGQYQKDPVPRDDRAMVLKRIEDDPKKAMEDYGKESGVCGRCASPLTDPTSLSLGIGPVCRRKSGWY